MKIADLTKGNSPYAKYGKRPFVYSDLYQTWAKEAAVDILSDETIAADRKFRDYFHVPQNTGNRVFD